MSKSLSTLLADLIRINSVNTFYPCGPGEAELGNFVEAYFHRHAIATERQNVLPATASTSSRDNIIASLPGVNPDRTLVLEAHMDTVSTDGMTIDPGNP